MDHAVDLLGSEGFVKRGGILEGAMDQEGEGRHGISVTGGEIVEDQDRVTRADQLLDDDAADVARAPDDEDVHGGPMAARMARSAAGASGARKIEWPATNVSAP